MYLTAHRVRETSNLRREGVNAFLFQHHGDVPGMEWRRPLLPLVVDLHPGELVSDQIEMPPGGNVVLSYLDVVCADETALERIDEALRRFDQKLPSVADGLSHSDDDVAIRLGMVAGLQGDARGQFDALRGAALKLLSAPRQIASLGEPLRIEVAQLEDEVECSLQPSSAERLRARPGRPAPAVPSVRVKTNAGAPVRADTYLHLLPVLTGLTLDELLMQGGAEFARADTGEVLWTWPSKAAITDGLCLSCLQRNTLVPTEGGVFHCAFCGRVQDNDGLWLATLT